MSSAVLKLVVGVFWLVMGCVVVVVCYTVGVASRTSRAIDATSWRAVVCTPTPALTASPPSPSPTLPRTTASLETRVRQRVPALPTVSSRFDIRPRQAVVQAFVQETHTEPLTHWQPAAAAHHDHDDHDDETEGPTTTTTERLRVEALLTRLKTLPKKVGSATLFPAQTHSDKLSENLSPRVQEMAATTTAAAAAVLTLTHDAVQEWLTTRGSTTSQAAAVSTRRPHRRTASVPFTSTPVSEMVEMVLYLNENPHRLQRSKIEKEITRVFRKEDRVETLRVLSEPHADPVMAKFMSHVSALSIACESQRNVLVLEDTFQFYVTREELEEHLRVVQREFGDRWQVVVLGHVATEWAQVEHAPSETDPVQLMRILQGDFTAGYLVNRHYVPVLLNWMMEHIYSRFPESEPEHTSAAATTTALLDVQKQLQHLQSTDMWLGFQSPVGGTQGETLDELAVFTGPEEGARWAIQKHAVYVKATEAHLTELARLLRHLYVERYKGHRLSVVVHHPPGQKLAHRHKRSYSSTFFEGVKYMTEPAAVEAYLQEFETVPWIDLPAWCQSGGEHALSQLLRVLDDTDTTRVAEVKQGGPLVPPPSPSLSSSLAVPRANAQERHRMLSL